LANQKLKFDITADNKASAALKQVHNQFQDLGKPLDTFAKATSRFSSHSVLGRFTGMVGDAHGALTDLVGGMGEAASGAEGVGAGMAAAALGVGVFAGAALAAGGAAVAFANKWSGGAAELGRTAVALGMTTDQLQLLGRAGQYSGISVEDTTGALHGLGNTLNDAKWGRNQGAQAMMQRFGISVNKATDGTIDTQRALMDLADVIQRQANPQTQEMISNMFGVTALLPELRKGAQGYAADVAKAKADGPLFSKADADAAQKYQESLHHLNNEVGALGNEIGSVLVPALDNAVTRFNNFATSKDTFWNKAIKFAGKIGDTLYAPGPLGDYSLDGFASADEEAKRAQAAWDAAHKAAPKAASKPVSAAAGGSGSAVQAGMRWNNPGDLMVPGTHRFQHFKTLDAGLAAMALQVQRDVYDHGNNTLNTLIGGSSRFPGYAPASENDTAGYIRKVSAGAGIDANAALDLSDKDRFLKLLDAMLKVEGGNPASADQLRHAIDVVVHLPNAPAGTAATIATTSAGKVAGAVRIGLGMPNAGTPVAAGAQ
jgi:hypothetical protein